MGEGAADERWAEAGGGAVQADPDAPWRRDFGGWAEFEIDELNDVVTGPSASDADPGWSRAQVEAAPEPWVPQRAHRVARPAKQVDLGRPVSSVPGQPPSTAIGSVMLGGIVALALVAAGLFAAVAVRPSAKAPVAEVRAPMIPTAPDVLWTAELAGKVDAVGAGASSVVVYSSEADVMIAYDRVTGEDLWSRATVETGQGVDRLVVIDDVIALQWRGPAGALNVDTFDAPTGSSLWSSATVDADTAIAPVVVDYAIVRRTALDGQMAFTVLDPRTGEPLAGPVVTSGVDVPGPYLGESAGAGQVSAWSLEQLGPVTPPIDSFNVRSIAPMGDLAVGLDEEGRIIAFDELGERTDERLFTSDAFGEFTSRAALAGVLPDARIGLISSGSSVGFAVVNGQIETRWQRLGRVFAPVETEAGAFSVLLGPTGEFGEVNESIIDPVSGDTIAVTDAGATREKSPMLGHNGFLVAPEIGQPDRTLTGFSYDGVQMWELVIPDEARYETLDGMIVLIEHESGVTTVSIAG